jgi:hypothetical protein
MLSQRRHLLLCFADFKSLRFLTQPKLYEIQSSQNREIEMLDAVLVRNSDFYAPLRSAADKL